MLVSRALFVCVLFGCLSRKCLVHCFVFVLLTFSNVNVSRTILYVFCFVVCYVSVSCTVLHVLCLTVCYVTASRTVLYVFCLLVCYVSGSHPVLYMFC